MSALKSSFTLPLTFWGLAVAMALFAGRSPRAGAQAPGVFRELFTGFNRANGPLWQLTNDTRFLANTPTSTNILATFSAPQAVGEDYGQRVRGFLTAPTTGNYTFAISSDEVGQLFLGTNENPKSKRLIAFCDPRAQPGNYTTHAGQQSSNLFLEAGRRYYIEALHAEANLIDHLSVQWRLPNNVVESPIPTPRLQYDIAPLVTATPTNRVVEEGRPAVFQTETANFLPQHFRWQRGGSDIPGATNSNYTLFTSTLADDGARFRAFVTNRLGATNTPEVTLTVLRDTNAPVAVSVLALSRTNLLVTFSESVAAASALDANNYSLAGVTIQDAVLESDARTVSLRTSPLLFGKIYTLLISGVKDSASQANTMASAHLDFMAREFNPQAIGDPAQPGSIVMRAGGVDVSGSGVDSGERADEFQFGYGARSGNFDLKVRVLGLDFTDLWAKAGLMARESLAADSRFAAVFATPTSAGCFFQHRATTRSLTTKAGSFPVSYPDTWLRLRRVGDLFSGYASMDGQNWTQLGSVANAMSNQVYFGYAVSSQRTNRTATAQFRDFATVTGGTIDTVVRSREILGPSSRKTGLVISEIMYHPRDVFLGVHPAELEFVELFNSTPSYEDISGYRLAGDIDYTFPPGTVLEGGQFLVVARSPADLQSVSGNIGVLGPFTNNLPNDAGRIRLRNESGAVLLEVNYSAKFPWPSAADGAGHSLVLARPSFGEGQRAAWAASDAMGGSPGGLEPLGAEPLRPVLINEFLAHTDSPTLDFIELYNHSDQPVDIGGAWLSDSAVTNKFRIPSPTTLAPRGFVSFDQNQLGFSLNSAGERILLVNSNQTRVIDAFGFEPQAKGICSGRFPDGAPEIRILSTPSPDSANPGTLAHDIVINEIMYHPISGESDDEFVELHNKGDTTVNLEGWRFTDGIEYTFPPKTVILAGGYVVVARNLGRLLAHYSSLNSSNTVGNFIGSLRDSGERVALAKPHPAIHADDPLNITTNTIYVEVDAVEFGVGGRWGKWADGGGSSLELIDPRADNHLAPNWADSDESAKAPWSTIETTGVLDNGGDQPTALHVLLLEEGECLLDNVEVFRSPAGGNLIPNPTFESGTNGWSFRGNHQRSSRETTEGFNSSRSLHIRASSRGDIGANKIFINVQGLVGGQTATIRAKARWLRGWPELLLRLRGSWLEATDRMIVPHNLGTPGAPNSRRIANAGPAITDASHAPAVPAANQPVVVTARVTDPEKVTSVVLQYRLDPANTLTALPMNDAGTGGDAFAGDGIFSGTIPGQATDRIIAFFIAATDGASATARFPASRNDNGPARECLVHFGSPLPAGAFGTYRFWITQRSITNWVNREALSNERIPGTFVYGDQRIVYDAGARYSGSPAHQDQAAPDYSPVGTPNNYTLDMAKDDLVLGTDNFNKIHGAGNNHHDDNTLQRETIAYWMARRLGLTECHKRYVAMYINGARRGRLMEDTQVPNNDYIESAFPDDANGDLYKLSIWYEFGAPGAVPQVLSANGLSECNLNNYTTAGGVKKRARYRWNWQGRAVHGTANDYTNVFALIDAANTPVNGPFAQNLEAVADMEQWMRTFALEHALGNWDSFGYRNEQNMFAYKPERDRWKLLIWDINIIFGGGTRGTPVAVTDDLFEFDASNGPMANIYNSPQFRRAYYRALHDIINGPLLNANADPVLDARFATFAASGVHVSPPDAIKTWIALRRAYIESQLSAADTAAFAITTPDNFVTNNNVIQISGTAPFAIKTIEINGVARLVTWSSVSNWTVRLPVDQMRTENSIVGYDPRGQPVPGASGKRVVHYSGPVSQPEGLLVLNEIHYNPPRPETEFIEILNISTNFAFDLSNWRLNGANFAFAEGTLITNQQFLLVVKNRAVFSQVYGTRNAIAGEYGGRLDTGGETLTLERPVFVTATNGAIVTTHLVYRTVDEVRYESELPWPTPANGTGPSLQLTDATQDNSRVSNWGAGSALVSADAAVAINATPGVPNLFVESLPPYDPLWLNELQSDNGRGITDNFGEREPWIELYNAGTNTLPLDGYFLADNYTANLTDWPFPPGSSIAPGEFKIVWADGEPGETTAMNLHTSFRLPPTTGAIALVRIVKGQPQITDYLTYANLGANLSYGAVPDGQPFHRQVLNFITPRTENVTPTVALFINEWLAGNRNTLTDPADSDPEDWFELYNAGSSAVNLAGFYLTDTLADPTKFRIPNGYTISPGGFLLVWADEEPEQNLSHPIDLHVNFRIASGGETIGLFSPTGGAVDQIAFGQQTNDISQGRYSDGAAPIYFMTTPTPRGANTLAGGNAVPQWAGITVTADGRVALTMQTIVGKTYRLEYKHSLNDPVWIPIAPDRLALSDRLTLLDDIGASTQRFYHLVILE